VEGGPQPLRHPVRGPPARTEWQISFPARLTQKFRQAQPANQAAAALALLQDPNYPFDLLSTKSTEDFTAECVEDAITRIRQYAVPYFEDAAREAG
jgi:hypothetical protein